MVPGGDTCDMELSSTYVHLAGDGTGTPIEVTPAFWAEIAQNADLQEGWLVALGHHGADWPHWEMHPEGEELLVMMSGALRLTLDDGGPVRFHDFPAGTAFLVPRGTWHWAEVVEPGDMLSITAGKGTQHRPYEG